MKTTRKKLSLILASAVLIAVMTALLSFCASAAEVWQLESITNMRKTASTSASVLYAIPSGTKITVTAKKADKYYIWGKIRYKNNTGWCALNYSKYKSGSLGSPTVTTTAKSFREKVSIKWKSVPAASKYIVSVYRSSGSLYKKYSFTSAAAALKLPKGSYKLKVTAKNAITPSWSASSTLYSFKVLSPLVSSVKISGTSTLIKGKTATLKASVQPSNAENKSVTWSSSDKKVLSVSSKGVIKAVSFGKAVITCKAKDAGKKSAKLTVTVIPATPKTPVQTSATPESVTFKWAKVSGATGYRIYKYNSSAKKYEAILSQSSTTCKLTGLKPGTKLNIKVKACAKNKYYSAASAALSLYTAPGIPKSFSSTGIYDTKVEFKWAAVSGATKYLVYEYDTEQKAYLRVGYVEDATCTLKAKAGEKVKVKVKAVKVINGKNFYSDSSEVYTMYTLPPAPVLSVKAGSSGAVSISWKEVEGATGYIVYSSDNAKYDFTAVSHNSALIRELNIPSLSKGTHYFKVRAYMTVGTATYFGAYSSVKSATVS